MRPLALRAVFAYDLARFAFYRARSRRWLRAGAGTSPNLRMADVRVEPGGQVEIAPGFATERQRGNQIWVQSDGRLRLGRQVWLRTEYGSNYLTLFPGAELELGDRTIVNGAMIHAKVRITIGEDALIGFGVRVLDSDLHDLDENHPEKSEPVTLGDRVWLAANSVVLRGVSIGDDTVVAAGSVVTKSLPSNVLAAGVPARPIREIGSRKGCR